MGCSDSKEKLEDQMLNLQISRIELQMERYKQLQLLKEEKGIEPNFPKIPDYIDQKFAINQSKRNSMSTNIKEVKNNPVKRRSKSFKTKRVTIKDNKNLKITGMNNPANNQQNNFPEKRRENRSRSVAIKLDNIDENDTNAKELKAKRRAIILGKANEV